MTPFIVGNLKTLALISAVVVTGCESVTGPQTLPEGVEIRTTSGVFPVETVDGRRRVRVTATVTNESSRTVLYSYCSEAIARNVAGVWTSVWKPICPALIVAPESIAPGETREFNLQIDEHPELPNDNFPFDSPQAQYRLELGLFLRIETPYSEKLLPIDGSESVSNTFAVGE